MTRLITEFGFGTSLRRGDYTQAAERAIRNALWRNSINLAELYDLPKTAMRIRVEIGVMRPDLVDVSALGDVFPYGTPEFEVRHGGLDVARPGGSGNPTVMANAALSVSLEGAR